MREVFQNYEHYANWILANWQEKSEDMNKLILESGLLVERENNCNGETHRSLTKEEFLIKESGEYIMIPHLS
jgi:hypothetical protein